MLVILYTSEVFTNYIVCYATFTYRYRYIPTVPLLCQILVISFRLAVTSVVEPDPGHYLQINIFAKKNFIQIMAILISLVKNSNFYTN